jgi:hypothetical protein
MSYFMLLLIQLELIAFGEDFAQRKMASREVSAGAQLAARSRIPTLAPFISY